MAATVTMDAAGLTAGTNRESDGGDNPPIAAA